MKNMELKQNKNKTNVVIQIVFLSFRTLFKHIPTENKAENVESKIHHIIGFRFGSVLTSYITARRPQGK